MPTKDEHTPGPWRIEPVPGEQPYSRMDIIGATEWVVAEQIELNADARLVAAAPDLLAALRNARGAINSLDIDALGGHEANHPEDEPYSFRDALLHELDEAIAKATGRKRDADAG